MIKAKHHKAARFLFDLYIDRLLERSFQSFYLINSLPEISANSGLIITPNHFSWWDGFFIDYLCKKNFTRNFYIMMLEHQLERYWFFKYLGAYSINKNNPKSIVETFNYTIELINDRRNLVVIYPQGEIEPYDSHPFILKRGIQSLLKKNESEITLLPLAFKIYFREEKKPNIYCRFGNPVRSETINNNFSNYEDEFNNNLSELDKAIKMKGSYINLFE